MGVRKFKIKNSRGDSWDLNNTNTFAHLPNSLGVSFGNSYINSKANYLLSNKLLNQQIINFEMVFGHEVNTPYITYLEFIEFLNFPDYTLEYTTDAGTWYRDCKLNSFGKSELDISGLLKEPLSLDCLTPWYQLISDTDVTYEPTIGGGKVYDLRTREYIYEHYNSENIKGLFRFNNPSVYMDTAMSSPLEISIQGACTNPYWELYQNGVVTQSDQVNVVLSANDTLIVSSFPQDQKVIKKTAEVITNMYASQNLSKTNFVTIPKGESTLLFGGTSNAKISFRARYEWVVV